VRLEGIHHVTCVTADVGRNVSFYRDLLGLRLVKRTVDDDDPVCQHVYYGDDRGEPGSLVTFVERAAAPAGRAGAGMVHAVVLRIGSDSLDFWAARLAAAGIPHRAGGGVLELRDPDGLALELAGVESPEPPLVARAPGVPLEHAIGGVHAVRAYAARPADSEPLLVGHLGFETVAEGVYRTLGVGREGVYVYDQPPPEPGVPGAGTVLHVAWASVDGELDHWLRQAARGGASVSELRDRRYFRAVSFHEPSGVLFELATAGPGFVVDEPLESLGRRLCLPARLEGRRGELERTLAPLPAANPA
jgi:glyoxalase family protein